MNAPRQLAAWMMALVIGLWNPVCLCCNGHALPERSDSAPACAHKCETVPHSDEGDDHGPGPEHKGCGCPDLVAVKGKAEHAQSGDGWGCVAVSAEFEPAWSPVEHVRYATAARGAVPRSATTLLRLHCALIV